MSPLLSRLYIVCPNNILSSSSVRHSLLEARQLFDSLGRYLGIVMFQVVFDA